MPRRRLALLSFVLGAVCALPVDAGDLIALGPEQVVNQNNGFSQDWGKVALVQDGSRFAVAFEWFGNDVYLRFFDADGQGQSGSILVNAGLTSHTQDEPMVALDAAGNLLVCWSDRKGYDGSGMGCFGRIFLPTGAAWGPPFQINQVALQSQWEPMPSALPGGGWVVAFNGEDDGDAFLRYFDATGVPTTGDLRINTFDNNGQTEAECAVSPAGVVFAVYADFGGNVQAGTLTNLLARRFDSAGAVLDPVEFVVNTATLAFDQLEPRLAADPQGRFVMVWEDWGHDGSGAGIWARRYAESGAALGPEWQVNTTTAGDQLLPEVACDAAGNSFVVWEDRSTGGRIVAQRYDPQGLPLGGEFPVSDGAVGYGRPSVAVDAAGRTLIFSYRRPSGADSEVCFKRFLVEDDLPLASDPRVAGARAGAPASQPGSPPAPPPAGPPLGPPKQL